MFVPRMSWRAVLLSTAAMLTLPYPAEAQDDGGIAEARALMEQAFPAQCASDIAGGDADERFEFRYRFGYESPTDPEHVAILYHIGCGAGAYNLIGGYVLRDAYDELSIVAFAKPELDIDYENDDFEGKVERIEVAGFNASHMLINSTVDSGNQTITSFNKWRGLGDAWSSGTWQFREGRFVLVKFEVDATYDEALDGIVVYAAPGQ